MNKPRKIERKRSSVQVLLTCLLPLPSEKKEKKKKKKEKGKEQPGGEERKKREALLP